MIANINIPQNGLLLNLSENTSKFIFIAGVVLCLTPLVSPAVALLLGLIVAQFTGHPYLHLNHKATHILLQASVVGLGFGMNIHTAMQVGKEGVLFTVASISGTLFFGLLMGKFLRIEQKPLN